MKAAIYGAGAMGTVLGAYIARAGREIDLISRNEEHVACLRANGAHITGTVDFTQPVRALLPSEMEEKYDLFFLMTKQSHNREIVSFLKNYLAEGGAIVTLQNGLPEEGIAREIGKDNVYGCAAAWGATFVGKGESRLTSSPDRLTFSLGCYGKADDRLFRIKELLECMGKAEVVDDLIGARWSKLTLNAAFSGLSTLTGRTFGEIAADRTGGDIALAVMNECFSVAERAGIAPGKVQGHDIAKIFRYRNGLHRRIARFLLPMAMKSHASLESGMLAELKKGNRCEIEYIDGVVRDFGVRCGTATPLCEKICVLVHEIEDGKRDISSENLRELIDLR